MKIAPVSGDMLVKIALGGLVGLAAWYAVRQVKAAAGSFADSVSAAPGKAWEAISSTVGGAIDAVISAPGAVIEAATEKAAEIGRRMDKVQSHPWDETLDMASGTPIDTSNKWLNLP